MDRGKEEIVGVSEAGIADNFAGPQQCTMMNAFDLLQPTIKRQLESGTCTIYGKILINLANRLPFTNILLTNT